MSRPIASILAGVVILVAVEGCAWWPHHREVSPLVGTWANRVGAVWTIKKDGTFNVDLTRDGKSDVWGTYTVEGDMVTLATAGGMIPKDCRGDAVYRFQRNGPELAFKLVRDDCKLRRTSVLLGWRLRHNI